MVVVKQGPLAPPGKRYKVYLNEDSSQKWYLRVTHTFVDANKSNKHFRAGTYDTQEEALAAVQTLDPLSPKKSREKRGTVDHYANGQWRVRIKHRGEHMHVGYFKDKEKAYARLNEVLNDEDYLNDRYDSLMAKRARKRQLNKTSVIQRMRRKREYPGSMANSQHKRKKHMIYPFVSSPHPHLMMPLPMDSAANVFHHPWQATQSYENALYVKKTTPHLFSPPKQSQEMIEWCELVTSEADIIMNSTPMANTSIWFQPQQNQCLQPPITYDE